MRLEHEASLDVYGLSHEHAKASGWTIRLDHMPTRQHNEAGT